MTSSGLRRSENQEESSLTMVWLVKRLNDMEESLRSTRNAVQVRCQELEDRETRVMDYTTKLDVLKAEKEKRDMELRELEKQIKKTREEAVKSGSHLDSLKMLIEEHKEELEIKEKRFKDVEKMIGLKERECEMVEKRRNEGLEKLSRVEKEIEEKSELKQKVGKIVEVKGKVLGLYRGSMEEWSRKVEAKGKEVEEMCKKIEVKEKELESRVEEIFLIEKRVNGCLNEIELKERYLQSLEKSIQERGRSLEERGKRLDSISDGLETREKKLESVKKSIQENEKLLEERRKCLDSISNGFDRRMKELDALKKSIQEREISLEERGKCLDSKSNGLETREKELKSVEKSVQGLEESLEEWEKNLELISDGLEIREKELDRKAKENELKQCEPAPGSNVVSSLMEVGEPESLVVKEAPASSSNLQLSDFKSSDARKSEGRGSGNDMLENQCFAKLESSLDPAKLVLDWMQTYLSQFWTKGDAGFDVTSIKTYITLLEQLMRLSPHAGAQVVKEGINKLAIQWKANMRADTDNSLEILGFLHFVATFRLLDTLYVDDHEIAKLLGMISRHREALELCQTLGFADKIPEFIRTLVERKQLMGAVRLICTFQLIEKFPPGPLLKEYMEEEITCCRNAYKSTKLHDEKVRIVDDQITRLRSAMNLIKYYKLESECGPMKIEKKITQLQHVKENWRLQLGNVQTVQKRGTKRSSDSLASTFEPSLQPNKFHRTVVPVPRPPAW